MDSAPEQLVILKIGEASAQPGIDLAALRGDHLVYAATHGKDNKFQNDNYCYALFIGEGMNIVQFSSMNLITAWWR